MTTTKDHLIRLLIGSSIICVLMVALRFLWTSSFGYSFLIWNLFLAWMPLFLALYVRRLETKMKSRFTIAAVFLSWLVFFPNAPYILTDMVHLNPDKSIGYWYDLILILLCAWNGLILGLISLNKMHHFLIRQFKQTVSWFFITGIIVLSSFGIYLGRVQRYNSWDIIMRPGKLFTDILSHIIYPLSYPGTLSITFGFSVFLMISYLTFLNFNKSRSKV